MYDSGRPWAAYDRTETDEQKQERDFKVGKHMMTLPALVDPPPKLPVAEVFPLSIDGVASGVASNPSLALLGEDIVVNVRCQDRTTVRNVLGVLGGKQFYSRTVVQGGEGFEDIRLFVLGGVLHGIAARNPKKPDQAVIRFDSSKIATVDFIPASTWERNWMPAVVRGEDGKDRLKLVYSVNPLVVLDYTPLRERQANAARTVPDVAGVPVVLGDVRGGSQLIPYGEGWLAVVYQAHGNGNKGTRHVHRFALFDRDLGGVRLGRTFYLAEEGPEFCTSLVERDGEFLLGFGLGDRRAVIAETRAALIEEFLP